MTQEPELVMVRLCQGMDVAQIYKSKLEAMEIPVLLRYESAGLVYGITVDGLGAVRIMVPEPYAEQARAILTDLTEEEMEMVEDEEEEEEEGAEPPQPSDG